VPGTNGTVRLGSERKFSSGTWKIFVILPRALAIDDDFKNLPWLIPDRWKAAHPVAVREYRAQERRDKADMAVVQAARRRVRAELRQGK
jgi:hypothetical protein